MKRLNLNVYFCIVMVFFLMGFSLVSSAEPEHSLRLSADSFEGEASTNALYEFAEEVFKRSDGRIEITIYPGAQLGNYPQTYPEVMIGSIDMLFGVLPGQYDQRVKITHLPYMVRDYNDASELWGVDGELTNIIREITQEKGVKAFYGWGQGFGGYSFAKKPQDVADLSVKKNLKLRVASTNKAAQETAKALGYNVLGLPRGEVLVSLETGVIDGSVGSSAYLAYQHERDFIDHFVWYHDNFAVWFLVMNLNKFNSLSEQDQQMMEEVAKEKFKNSVDLTKEVDLESIEKLREYGIEVIELTDDEINTIANHIRETVWPKVLPEETSQEFYERILEIVSSQ